MHDKVRELVRQHAGLPAGTEIGDDLDLYRAGMKSFASVQLMLALEETYDIEFPEQLLTRATFRSVSAIAAALATISPDALAA
jgi:acyl carrier protein